MPIYLDNAATTALAPEVLDYLNVLNAENYGNPSSLHSVGRHARKLLNETRKIIADKINAVPSEIVFTSCATEANNTVFVMNDYDCIITTPIEHPSVLEPAKNSRKEIQWLNLDREGFISLEELESLLAKNQAAKKTTLVSIMHGNSEIGTVQDIESIGSLSKKYNAIFHSDCVQTFCKRDIDVKKCNLDFISVSAHKIHGPKGVGFLYINKESAIYKEKFKPALLLGGGQERNWRSGTENTNSIIAMGKAITSFNPSEIERIREMQEFLIEELLKLDGAALNGAQDLSKRVAGNVNISLPSFKLNSEQLVLRLDLAGICISAGSACSANKNTGLANSPGDAMIESSYVLRACHTPSALAETAVRMSISKLNRLEEIKESIEKIKSLT